MKSKAFLLSLFALLLTALTIQDASAQCFPRRGPGWGYRRYAPRPYVRLMPPLPPPVIIAPRVYRRIPPPPAYYGYRYRQDDRYRNYQRQEDNRNYDKDNQRYEENNNDGDYNRQYQESRDFGSNYRNRQDNYDIYDNRDTPEDNN